MRSSVVLSLLFLASVHGRSVDESTRNETRSSCIPLHSRAPGLNLVCCDKTGGLSPDCQYRRLCKTDGCSCSLTVLSGFSCKYQSAVSTPVQWADHRPPSVDPLPCPHLNLPNPSAEYTVTVQKWSQNFSMLLLMSLREHNVTSLEIDLDAPIDPINLANLDELLPNVERLIVKASPMQRGVLMDSDFLGRFSRLKFLKMVNVDFKLPENKAQWTGTLERLHVESSSIRSLPRWMSACSRLTNLVLRNTQVDSIMTISRMPALVFVYADANQLNDLEKVSFASRYLEVMDLSNNRITQFSAHTFSQLKALRFLDLSKNEITALPLRGFQSNGQLKYLHLEETGIQSLGPEHLTGLHTLKQLSLSRNPLQSIDPFAFLPVRMVRTLEMDDCNLTTIPLAATQLCMLSSLSMSGNLFYDRSSLPTEILALISHVDHLNFGRNPLVQLPYGLFLLDRSKHALMKGLVDTLTQLPVWHLEPCTSYLFHLHLKDSPPDVRKRLAAWNPKRMKLEKLEHCEQLYDSILTSLEIGLKQHSGCEMTRKYRSIRSACKTNQLPNSSIQRFMNDRPSSNCSSSQPSAMPIGRQRSEQTIRIITVASLSLNILFLAVVVVRLLFSVSSSSPKSRRESELPAVHSTRVSAAPSNVGDVEEQRRALLRAFEISRR